MFFSSSFRCSRNLLKNGRRIDPVLYFSPPIFVIPSSKISNRGNIFKTTFRSFYEIFSKFTSAGLKLCSRAELMASMFFFASSGSTSSLGLEGANDANMSLVEVNLVGTSCFRLLDDIFLFFCSRMRFLLNLGDLLDFLATFLSFFRTSLNVLELSRLFWHALLSM